MESKLIPGLYFSGEILDVDGFVVDIIFNGVVKWISCRQLCLDRL